jgi:hypothetical protein
MTDGDDGTGGEHGNTGGHPRAYIARKPNGGYVMKGRGKPSYTFYLLFFALLWVAVIIAAAR